MGPESFSKSERLRKRAEFLEVQRLGKKVQSEHFLVLAVAAPKGRRVGITVSSKVGNAVVRNRLKRWMREYVRRHKGDLPPGDAVLVAKPSAAALTHAALAADLARLLRRAQDRDRR